MKTAVVLLSIIAVCLFVMVAIFYAVNEKTSVKLTESQAQIASLNNANTQLLNDNAALTAQANLKSFENLKALQRFLKDAKSPREATASTFASETCIGLMREAKEKGYWMGLTVINTTDESVYSAMLRDKINPNNDVQWHTFNIAIVGDSDIYLVDSQDITSCYFIVSVQGDFSDYNNDSVPNVDVLKLH